MPNDRVVPSFQSLGSEGGLQLAALSEGGADSVATWGKHGEVVAMARPAGPSAASQKGDSLSCESGSSIETGKMEGIQMAMESIEQKVDVLRETIVALVRRDGPDLSARQLGVLLTCYREDEAQTVRGLAAKLDVSKPAITRALDRLSEFDLVRRKTDPLDRRSVLVQRTVAGNGFMRDLKTILTNAGKAVGKVPSRGRRIGETV
jgi:DNA-binding MarR family transcriptional regulator